MEAKNGLLLSLGIVTTGAVELFVVERFFNDGMTIPAVLTLVGLAAVFLGTLGAVAFLIPWYFESSRRRCGDGALSGLGFVLLGASIVACGLTASWLLSCGAWVTAIYCGVISAVAFLLLYFGWSSARWSVVRGGRLLSGTILVLFGVVLAPPAVFVAVHDILIGSRSGDLSFVVLLEFSPAIIGSAFVCFVSVLLIIVGLVIFLPRYQNI